jgi:hypothetical protein
LVPGSNPQQWQPRERRGSKASSKKSIPGHLRRTGKIRSFRRVRLEFQTTTHILRGRRRRKGRKYEGCLVAVRRGHRRVFCRWMRRQFAQEKRQTCRRSSARIRSAAKFRFAKLRRRNSPPAFGRRPRTSSSRRQTTGFLTAWLRRARFVCPPNIFNPSPRQTSSSRCWS